MTGVEWASLAAVVLLGAMSPGPSLAVVVSNTLRRGAGAGIQAGLAHGFGVALGSRTAGLLPASEASAMAPPFEAPLDDYLSKLSGRFPTDPRP